MKLSRSALVYTALALGAIAAGAFVTLREDRAPVALRDMSALEALRTGSMEKLNFHSTARPAGQAAFFDADGAEHTLSEYQGHYVLLNFWATWCAPCLAEMPSLEALQKAMQSENFEVVTIATGRNPLPTIIRFYEKTGVESLPILTDPHSDLAREMAVLGLPITVILDPEGQEIARLQGEADWSSQSALAIIAALTTP